MSFVHSMSCLFLRQLLRRILIDFFCCSVKSFSESNVCTQKSVDVVPNHVSYVFQLHVCKLSTADLSPWRLLSIRLNFHKIRRAANYDDDMKIIRMWDDDDFISPC